MIEFSRQRPRTTQLLFFVCGTLTMLSFAPAGWYPVAPVLLLPLLYASVSFDSRTALRSGFFYGAGLFLAGTYWLYNSIHVIGQAPLWVAMFIMLCLVFIMALYYLLSLWLIRKLAAGDLQRLLIAAPAVWVTVEWLRGWVLSGFPWMTLGYSQIDSPLAGFAPVLGVYGISSMLVLSTTALLLAMLATGRQRAVMVIIAALPWLVGEGLRHAEWSEPVGEPVTATIVQGGISQERKWLRDQFQDTLNLYRASITDHPDSDIIVWPEVALPAVADQIETYLDEVEAEVVAQQQTLLLGILERELDDPAVYNSVMRIDGSPRQLYRKHHLVPFGEYFPVPDFVRKWMRMMSLPNTDLASGDARQDLLTTVNGLQLAIAICYEDAYPWEQRYALPDASILINVSNDAWFGDSIAPHQHLEIARMRAKEAARFVVRSTNNGISAFIGADGSIIERGPQFEYVAMSQDITPMGGSTPYARFGNWLVISINVLLMGGLAISRTRAAGARAAPD